MERNLLPQQRQAKTKLTDYKVGALFMEPGTGKTRVAVELVNEVPGIDLVVWVGPLRSIKPLEKNIPSIVDEVQKWGGFRAKEVEYIGVETVGQSDRQFLRLLNKVQHTGKVFIIVDESIKIKNIEAKRTQRLLMLGELAEYKLILNGEPITRDLLDVWAQFQFLDAEILNMPMAQFKNTFCKYTTVTKRFNSYKQYTKTFITGYENIDYLYSLIGEYVYECDLELNIEQIFETAKYKVLPEERAEYEYFKTKYLDNEMLMMLNNNIFLEMTQKMQHGYCATPSKFEAVDKWMKDESKTIIFCKYIASAEACKERYPEATVLNYKTGSMSLNLQEYPYTVYFDQTWDWGDVTQSQHRNYRTGQKNDCRYLRLIGDVGLEGLIYKNNQKKLGMSEYFKSVSRKELYESL